MTRAVSDRVLKDANGDISDHLRNHIHLTNCIHLKNHMHKQSPILADRALIRDLMVLQRSRSLRDPYASPPWHSASFADTLAKKGEPDVIREGRRSVGVERRKDSRRFSEIMIPSGNFGSSKVAPGEASGAVGWMAATSDHSIKIELRDGGRTRRGGSSRRNIGAGGLGENEEPLQNENGDSLVRGVVFGTIVSKGRKGKTKGKHIKDSETKTVQEHLNDFAVESEGVASSNVRPCGGHSGIHKMGEGHEANAHNHSSEVNKAKRRKFRRARRTCATSSSREVRGPSELSVASNSVDRGSAYPKHAIDLEEDAHREQTVPGGPSNGCGIPWNWSRIHYQGKTFLDKAGRSLSCGLSDSRLRKGAAASHGRGVPNLQAASDYSESSAKSDAEALPLLVEASGSQDSATANWVNDYSGELGIFAENLLKHGSDSDLVSEAQSGGQLGLGSDYNGQFQSLTQKYMPRTFTDLMGQNLVAQALSNAVIRKKVGLLYVFYGPPGTGKTSCARIFARALNCRSSEQPKPCGNCNSCITHDMGKSRNIREVGPVSNFDFQGIMDLIDNMVVSHLPSQYRVFIFDDCDTLSPDCWNALSKVIDRVPRRVIFVLVCSSLDVLPHMIISRCQKFFFPKLKDADIIYTLQCIASKEDIEIDKDAIKLIASRSDGSLRDAEMTLEQLSLLGQKISVPLVQELVGLISDERLIDLLDLALSADTVNTVKNLRDIMEAGVEPLALMSQLATVITDILAGSYDFTKERHRRKFFRHQPLSKENMERLRQALKTLSEAEKQLRVSNDKITWLTAALLQLAPEQQYGLPVSSSDISPNRNSLVRHRASGRDGDMRAGQSVKVPVGTGDSNSMVKGIGVDIGINSIDGSGAHQPSGPSDAMIRFSGKQNLVKRPKEIEQIWSEVLENIQNANLKEFLNQEGKLISISFGAAPTVQLMFSSPSSKSLAEKFGGHILQAFESTLGSSVTIEIRCETKKNGRAVPVFLPTSGNGSNPRNGGVPGEGLNNNQKSAGQGQETASSSRAQLMPYETFEGGRNEIVELPASPQKPKDRKRVSTDASGVRWAGNASASHTKLTTCSSGRRKLGEQGQSRSIVKSKVSLARVIQKEGCAQLNGWPKRKAVSIAEKLEQENLRLEPRTRSLFCWKASRLARLKIRSRRPHSLMKLVSCGKCLSSRSPR